MSWETWFRLMLMMPDRDIAKLQAISMRPVGFAAPTPPPMGISRNSFGVLSYVVLVYGLAENPLDPAEPVVEIQSCFAHTDGYRAPPLQAVLVGARDRDATLSRRPLNPEIRNPWADGADGRPRPEPGREPAHTCLVVADGVEHHAEMIVRDSYQALRFRHEELIVTVLARHGLPELVFSSTTDLQPFIAARHRTRRHLAAGLRSARSR